MFKIVPRLFVFTVFFTALCSSYAFAAKECLSDLIDREVEAIYANLDKTAAGQTTLNKVDKKIKDGTLRAEHKEIVLKANLEMAVRKRNGCSIPDDLKSNLTKFYEIGEDRGGRDHCGANKFLQDARKEYRKMQEDKNYATIEEMIFAEINLAIGDSAGQQKFAQKWQDQSFKDRVIITTVRVQLREENGCKNPALPLSELIHEMM